MFLYFHYTPQTQTDLEYFTSRCFTISILSSWLLLIIFTAAV